MAALLVAAALAGCAGNGVDTNGPEPAVVDLPPLPEMPARELDVAVAAVEAMFPADPGKYYHLNPRVVPPKLPGDPFMHFGRLQESTLADFGRKRSQACLAPPGYPYPPYLVLDRTDQVARNVASSEDGWNRYYASNPESQGYLEISRVGLSTDGRQALLYVGRQAGMMDGRGAMLLMEDDGIRWRVVSAVRLWGS